MTACACSFVDIPSRIMRGPVASSLASSKGRYTLTYNEGTLSVYAGFSRLKYLVVQFAQKAFCYHYHIFNMPKNLIH